MSGFCITANNKLLKTLRFFVPVNEVKILTKNTKKK
jgi:hypothetical protein